MGRPKRNVLATAQEMSSPPNELAEGQVIARVVKAAGNNLFNVEASTGKTLLVELRAQFRSTFWIKRGGYVLVDTTTLAVRENKLDGEIVNIVADEKEWRKRNYWPPGFAKRSTHVLDDDEEEESNVGKMPSDEEDDED